MTQRLYTFLRYYATIVAVFASGKLLFMLVNSDSNTIGDGMTPGNIRAAIIHGLPLDLCMSGYIAILPLLFFAFMKTGSVFLKTYNAIVAMLMATAIVVDTFLYGFWGFKLDATVLNYIDRPGEALASVSTGYVVLRLLFIILFAATVSFILPRKAPTGRRNPWMLLLTAPLFVVIRGGVSESTANVGMVYFSDNQFLNHSAVNPMFSFVSSIGKAAKYSDQFNFFEEGQRQQIFNGLYAKGDSITYDSQRLLKTQRPNILIIILEGFGANLVEATGGLKQVAPNLTAAAREGVLFSRCYANSFRTDRGVVSILSGFPGQPTTSVMKMPNRCGNLPSIAKSLKHNGYTTEFVYGGDINFTNMRGYLIATGYEKLVAKEDFTLKQQTSNAWGAQDEHTAERVAEEIGRQSRQPWLMTYLTLSSHEPFEVPSRLIPDDDILNSFAYTDSCIGSLISRLKTTSAWNDLLVIMLPDHNIRGVKAVGNLNTPSPNFYHIPMIWTGGALKDEARGKKMGMIMSQTDLAATMLGQMATDHSNFEFSRNVLADSYDYPFAFSTFNNGIVFRDSTGATVYDNTSNNVIADTPTKSETRLQRGKAILQTLYDRLEALDSK